jgi:hypothetical protein
VVNSVNALDVLKETRIFQKLSLDETGELFENIKAFYILLRENSSSLFCDLYNCAENIEGKLYAVVGVYLLEDKMVYGILKKDIENFFVTVASGDRRQKQKIADILKELERGELQEFLFWHIDTRNWEIIRDEKKVKIFQ